MGQIFAHPFRLTASGAVAVVDDTSDQGIAQLIDAIIETEQGERPMFADFGIPDPVFSSGIEPTMVAAVMASYGPNVTLTKLESKFTNATTQELSIGFDTVKGSSV